VGIDGGVVVEEQDPLEGFGQGPLDADVVASGKAEVGAGFEDGNVGVGGANGGNGVVCGAVVDDDGGKRGVVDFA